MVDKDFHILGRTFSAQQLFWLFVLLHLTLWISIPALVSPNPPLDVIEGYVWGHEWPIGTYKHPPMQAWWLESLYYLTGHLSWAHFIASQIAIVIAFWAVWQTGLCLAGERKALIGVLLLEGIVYYNYTSPEFNPNLMQLPFWALISLFYYRSIRDNKIIDWALLGICAAGGLYSKYSTALLLMSLFILTVARPESRRKLLNPGPYIAIAIASFLFLPHFLWLLDNHFLPFNYAEDRLRRPIDSTIIHSYVLAPLYFIGSQILACLPAILIFVALLGHRKPLHETVFSKFDRAFITTITFGPFGMLLIMASFFGLQIRDMWATPFWNFLGLWALLYYRPVLAGYALYRFALSGLVITSFLLAMCIGQALLWPFLTSKALRIHFPGKHLAENINIEWENRYHKHLSYVVGDSWPAGNVAYFEHGRAHVLIEGNYTFSPWINPADLKHEGAVLVWCIQACATSNFKDETPAFVAKFPNAVIQPPLVLDKRTLTPVKPVTIGWAILPPE